MQVAERIEIPPSTTPGPVRLSVADLDRSIGYYRQSIGLEVLDGAAGGTSEGEARLGVGGRTLLRLVEARGASPSRGWSGLYHFALLVPRRSDLARWAAHAIRERVRISGVADHFVSEAIYLTDPDGHGIEIYADRPRPDWEGQVAQRMTTLPLDVQGLLSELGDPAAEPFGGLADGTRMGHVHLRVSEIEQTISFYRDVLGFELMAALGGQAAFLAAGGYHHHIGANTWESAGKGQPPAGVATLLGATVVLPRREDVDLIAARASDLGGDPADVEGGVLLHDPSGNAIELSAASAHR